MFQLDRERLYVLFSVDDRDVAVAWAEMQGFEIRCWDRQPGIPGLVQFGGGSRPLPVDGRNVALPNQISPGVYAYRVVPIIRPEAAEERVLEFVRSHPGGTASVYAELTGLSGVVGMLLRRLERKGLVAKTIYRKPGRSVTPMWKPAIDGTKSEPEQTSRAKSKREALGKNEVVHETT
jgi:hypothetical protein